MHVFSPRIPLCYQISRLFHLLIQVYVSSVPGTLRTPLRNTNIIRNTCWNDSLLPFVYYIGQQKLSMVYFIPTQHTYACYGITKGLKANQQDNQNDRRLAKGV